MKKGKKILSLGLATAMAFSVGASAFAVSAAEAKEPVYTPTYNDRVTEEKVGELLTNVDTLLDDLVWASYGGTVVNELFGALAGLGGAFATPEFWLKVDADLFKDLSGEINAETMKAYLAEHPVSIEASADIVANLEKLLPVALASLMDSTLEDLVPGIGDAGGFIASLAKMQLKTLVGMVAALAQNLLGGVDDLVQSLGIDRGEKDLITILIEIGNGASDPAIVEKGVNELSAYVMSIVKALMPNTVDKVVGLVKAYSDNQAAVLASVNRILDSESGLGGVAGLIGDATFKNAITWLQGRIEANTITVNEEAVLNLDSTINSILDGSDVAFGGAVKIPDLSQYVYITTEGVENPAMIKLSSVNDLVASIAAESCDSNADTFMIVFNYLYDNLFGNETTYNLLMTVLDLLPTLVPSITADTVNMIKGILAELKGDSALDMMENLMVLVGVLEDDSVPPQVPPTTDVPDDGTGNPATGDAAMGAVAFAGTVAAAGVFLLRKKK